MKMGYIIKAVLMLLLIGFQVAGDAVTPLGVMGLVFLAALWIFREKYYYHWALLAVEEAVIIAQAHIHPAALLLNGVLAFDVAARGQYWLLLLLLPGGICFLRGENLIFYFILLALFALCGYLRHTLDKKELSFREIYDRERRNRYALEEAKARLLNSAREAAHLAEIQERNRIAREIHDSLGHSLAGILLQLQAAVKALDKDEARARELFQVSVKGLAEAVNLLRDTVYNIRPHEKLGLEYFQGIIEEYQFCPADFSHKGDLSSLSANQVQILSAILKEALTNASRHSQATQIEVQLEVRKNIIRLYIRDNGVGCACFQEGMGISGMRERVQNAGGTISISPANGFMIVCVLPREESGGALSASAHRG